MMIRTQVYLPEELHIELKFLATQEGVNYSSLIREGVQEVIRRKTKRNTTAWGKGFIGAGSTSGPKKLASRIDYYLYGGGSPWGKIK